MIIQHGKGTTPYGPGVDIYITPDEVANAVTVWLMENDVVISGPRTIRSRDMFGGSLAELTGIRIYVDPSGYVLSNGTEISGKGPLPSEEDS